MTNGQRRQNGTPRNADRLDALSADLVRMLDPVEDDPPPPRRPRPPRPRVAPRVSGAQAPGTAAAPQVPGASVRGGDGRLSAVPAYVKVPLVGLWASATVIEQAARWWVACATWPAVGVEASMKASKNAIRSWLT